MVASNRSEIGQERAYRILAAERRRHVLDLLTEDRTYHLDDIQSRVAAREAETPVDSVPEDARHRTAVSLYHVDLPLLDEFGLIECDWEDREIELTADPEEAFPFDDPIEFERSA